MPIWITFGRQLWYKLIASDIAWTIIGNFNAVLGAREKRGGLHPNRLVCEKLLAFSNTCNLVHMNTRGAEFAWNNCRQGRRYTEVRLDRTVCNASWYSLIVLVEFW